MERFGIESTFLVELLTCVAATVAVLFVDLPTPPPSKSATNANDFLAGIRFIFGAPVRRAMFALQMVGYFTAAALQVCTKTIQYCL